MIREDTGVQATSKKQVGGFEIREDTGVQDPGVLKAEILRDAKAKPKGILSERRVEPSETDENALLSLPARSALRTRVAGLQEEAVAGGFFQSAMSTASPTVNTKKARTELENLIPSPTETVGFVGRRVERAASPTMNSKLAEEAMFDLLPSPTRTVCVGDADVVAGSSFVGGFRIREDTGVHIFADAESTEMRDKGPSKSGGGGGGFMIREDTGVQATSKKQVGGFEIREDTGVQAMPTGLEAKSEVKVAGFEILDEASVQEPGVLTLEELEDARPQPKTTFAPHLLVDKCGDDEAKVNSLTSLTCLNSFTFLT